MIVILVDFLEAYFVGNYSIVQIIDGNTSASFTAPTTPRSLTAPANVLLPRPLLHVSSGALSLSPSAAAAATEFTPSLFVGGKKKSSLARTISVNEEPVVVNEASEDESLGKKQKK